MRMRSSCSALVHAAAEMAITSLRFSSSELPQIADSTEDLPFRVFPNAASNENEEACLFKFVCFPSYPSCWSKPAMTSEAWTFI